MIARKEQAGKAIGKNPHVAQFQGSAKAPGGSPMHFSEYVPGMPLRGSASGIKGQEGHQEIRNAAAGAQKAFRSAGFSGAKDVRMGNMIKTPEGKVKVIDYLPTQRGEFLTNQASRAMTGNRSAIVPKTPDASMLVGGGGQGTPIPNLLRSQLSTPGSMQMKQRAMSRPVTGFSKTVMPAGDKTPVLNKTPAIKPPGL